jgi:hypothetical protein
VDIYFADDSSGAAEDRAGFVALAEEVLKWAEAHGLRITVSGTDKTAGIRFTPAHVDALPDPVTIRPSETNRARDLVIPFTRRYVFIGHALTDTLDPEAMQDAVLGRLRAGLASFKENALLHRCSLALQRTFLRSVVIGAASHLLAMAPPSPAFEKKIDDSLLMAVAHVFRTSPDGMSLLGHAMQTSGSGRPRPCSCAPTSASASGRLRTTCRPPPCCVSSTQTRADRRARTRSA